MNKKRKDFIASNEISEVKSYNLCGYEQKVALDGKYANSPIMLTLHGGPGSPYPFSVGCRGFYPEWTEHFIMVYWDQLGCGINNYPLDESFSIELFVEMTVQLIKKLKQEFPKNKLMLYGMSWGSILCAGAASKVPELIDQVFVYGQILNNLFFNEEVYAELDGKELSKKDRELFNECKQKKVHNSEDVNFIAKLINKKTDGYMCKAGERMSASALLKGYFFSPDYKFRDLKATLKNSYQKNTSLMNAVLKADLSTELENMKVPYYIIQGKTDIVTSTMNIERFISECQNPNLKLLVIPHNGHIPCKDGAKRVFEEAVKHLIS